MGRDVIIGIVEVKLNVGLESRLQVIRTLKRARKLLGTQIPNDIPLRAFLVMGEVVNEYHGVGSPSSVESVLHAVYPTVVLEEDEGDAKEDRTLMTELASLRAEEWHHWKKVRDIVCITGIERS